MIPHQRILMGFAVFTLVLWAWGTYLVPIVAGPVGGIFSLFGALGSLVSFVVLAFIGYWVYAFTVKKTGAEPEA